MVVDALKKTGVGGFTVLDAKGRGKGKRSQLEDHEALVATQQNLTQKIMFSQQFDDSLVDKVISAIINAAGTGSAGDGKIFVTTIDDAIDIGSKQRGVHAIQCKRRTKLRLFITALT